MGRTRLTRRSRTRSTSRQSCRAGSTQAKKVLRTASANDASPSCASLACLGADPRRPECWAATAGARQGRAVRTATPVVGLEGAHHASARRDGAASVRLRARKVRSTGATAAVRGEGECVGEGRRDRPNRRKAHAALEIKPTPCGAIYLQHVRFWGESAATLASSPKS